MEKNILIIEDDKDIREGVKILLEGEGYSVEEASNGADGLKKTHFAHKSSYSRYYDAWHLRIEDL